MIRTKFIEVAVHIVEHDEMKIHFVIYLKSQEHDFGNEYCELNSLNEILLQFKQATLESACLHFQK